MSMTYTVIRGICELGMRSIAEWLERLTANAKAAIVQSSIPASSDTMESEGGGR